MTKKNILLLHGALGSTKQFKALKNVLSNDFKVYDLNFEGHGGRPSTQDFSMDVFADNVIAFLQKHKIEQTNIFGYSMGGYVALTLALKHPNLVQKIVTLGTKFNWTPEVAEQEIKMLNPEKIQEKVPSFAKALEATHAPNDWKIVMQKTAQMMSNLGNGKKLNEEDLKQINHSALIGIGRLDRMVSLEESEQAANSLPNATLRIMEDFKHPIEKVDVHQLATMISDFILEN